MDAQAHAPNQARLVELDALRGVAALAVTLFHFTYFIGDMFPGTPRAVFAIEYGWFGVQLFFAISGFVILMTLDRTTQALVFVRARFWRLYPTYWLAMLLTFAAMHLFGPARLQTTWWEFALNLSMVQLFLEPITGVRMVDGAYWSLNVELMFYAVMLTLWRLRLLGRIEIILAGWVALKWAWPLMSQSLQKLLLLDHIAFFAIGIAAYRIHAGQRALAQQLPLLTLACASVFGNHVVPGGLLAVGLVVVLLAVASGRMAWFKWRPLRWLGDLSYPLYLLHSYIGYALILRLGDAGVGSDLAAWLALVLCVALAAGVVVLYERPITAWRRRFRAHARNASLDSAFARA